MTVRHGRLVRENTGEAKGRLGTLRVAAAEDLDVGRIMDKHKVFHGKLPLSTSSATYHSTTTSRSTHRSEAHELLIDRDHHYRLVDLVRDDSLVFRRVQDSEESVEAAG